MLEHNSTTSDLNQVRHPNPWVKRGKQKGVRNEWHCRLRCLSLRRRPSSRLPSGHRNRPHHADATIGPQAPDGGASRWSIVTSSPALATSCESARNSTAPRDTRVGTASRRVCARSRMDAAAFQSGESGNLTLRWNLTLAQNPDSRDLPW